MILVYDFLWKRIDEYAAKYQSGQQVVDAFNGALAEVQIELFTDLAPYYQVNEKVRAILAVWVKSANATAINGSYSIPGTPEFDRVISMAVTDTASPPNILYEISPITENELGMASRIPQRKPDLSKKRVYYLVDAPTTINFFPKPASLPFLIYYLSFPTLAKIAFTFSQTSNEDIMTYDPVNSIDLAWTKDASNIILYKMLEKFGVSVREQLLLEYSKLGVAVTMPSINNGGQ